MTLFRLFVSLLTAGSMALNAHAQLQPATGDRLTDYLDWFAPLAPTSATVDPAAPVPGSDEIDSPHRDWTRWVPNQPPTSLDAPIVGSTYDLHCEVVFLGETGSGWGAFGLRRAGLDQVLGLGAAERGFGDFALPSPLDGEPFDLFVDRSDGGRYYAFDKTLNAPSSSPVSGYWGILSPLASVRGDHIGLAGGACLPFAVFAFTAPAATQDAPPELFVFAVRAGYDIPIGPGAVPEPATYGLGAAVLLSAAALWRRRGKRAP